MSSLGKATNYDNFEGFVQENTVNRFKLISHKQVRISTNKYPANGQNMSETEFELCPQFL